MICQKFMKHSLQNNLVLWIKEDKRNCQEFYELCFVYLIFHVFVLSVYNLSKQGEMFITKFYMPFQTSFMIQRDIHISKIMLFAIHYINCEINN